MWKRYHKIIGGPTASNSWMSARPGYNRTVLLSQKCNERAG